MNRQENVLLSTLTTFKTGGPARFLFSATNVAEVAEAVTFAKKNALSLIPIGDGSNLCAPDEGVTAVFLKVAMSAKECRVSGDSVHLTLDAGLSWDEVVAYAVTEGWWGLENLSGIPGRVGASVVQNIGAYGAAISETVTSVETFDTKEMKSRTFAGEECEFGYRTSIFKKEADRYVILRITVKLSIKPKPNLAYRDLKKKFEGKEPTLQDIRHAVIEIRKGKFPELSALGTAGSFFLNPIISDAERTRISKLFPEMPLFDLPEGGVKVPLAWIFDRVLSLKGMREGGAFVWDRQPLVIVTENGAQSKDIYVLAGNIAQETFEKTGIKIVPEVRLFYAINKFSRS